MTRRTGDCFILTHIPLFIRNDEKSEAGLTQPVIARLLALKCAWRQPKQSPLNRCYERGIASSSLTFRSSFAMTRRTGDCFILTHIPLFIRNDEKNEAGLTQPVIARLLALKRGWRQPKQSPLNRCYERGIASSLNTFLSSFAMTRRTGDCFIPQHIPLFIRNDEKNGGLLHPHSHSALHSQ